MTAFNKLAQSNDLAKDAEIRNLITKIDAKFEEAKAALKRVEKRLAEDDRRAFKVRFGGARPELCAEELKAAVDRGELPR